MTNSTGKMCIVRTIALTAELDREIEKLAKKNGISVSALVRHWIKESSAKPEVVTAR